MKTCLRCRVEKPDEYFRQRQRSEDNQTQRLYSNCKQCEKEISQVVAKIKKTAPLSNGICDCCGKQTNKLHLDHCHNTETFRGWLCNNCNVGISRLGDDIPGIKMAYKYLYRPWWKTIWKSIIK